MLNVSLNKGEPSFVNMGISEGKVSNKGSLVGFCIIAQVIVLEGITLIYCVDFIRPKVQLNFQTMTLERLLWLLVPF